ncbi:CHAT domain-containing protein [Streptomyces zaomyceticus]|uniref:CHAT domain-containing protein n=1 Tax=Streptomyces zaomyceticus TaxID=68286 RepID=UPI0037A04B57
MAEGALSLAELMELPVPSRELTECVLGPVRDRAAVGPPPELSEEEDRQLWYALVGAVCERLGDRDSAVHHFRRAVGELDEESDEWPDALFRLADALHSRFLAQGELDDIQEALPLLEEAIDKVDEGSWPGLLIAGHIGRCLVDRFTVTGGREDLVTASRVIEAELTAAGDGDIDPEDLDTRIFVLDVLAECVRERAELAHDADLLEDSLRRSDQALHLAGEDPALRAAPEKGLARTLLTRAQWTTSVADLDRVIGLLDPSGPLAVMEHPAAHAVNLGLARFERYRMTGAREDLDEARSAMERAVDELPAASPARAGAAVNLAVILRECAPGAADGAELLDRAVLLASGARADTAAKAALSVTAGAAEAEARVALHALGGDLAELVEACRTLEAVAPHVPETGRLATSFWDAWGSALVRLGPLTSDPLALDRAVALLRRVLDDPGGAPDRPRTVTNLAVGLYERFLARGRMTDLDEAVEHWREAVETRNPVTPHAVGAHSGLGVALHQRYDRRGAPDDLDEAVERLTTAADLPAEPAERGAVLINLGHALQARFEATSDPAVLSRAVAAQREALTLLPPASGPASDARLGLALALGAQGEFSGRSAPVDEAVGHATTALRDTEPEARSGVSCVFALAGLERVRHDLTGASADRRAARDHYREGYEAARDRHPAAAAEGAMEWGAWEARRGRWSEAVAAFDLAEEAVGRLVAGQGHRSAKETWLRTSRGLPAAVALAAWRDGDAEGAVVRLERTRALLLAERLRMADAGAGAGTDPGAAVGPDASAALVPAAGTVVYLVPGADTGVAFTVRDGVVHATGLPELGENSAARRHALLAEMGRDGPDGPDGPLERFARWAWEHVLAGVVPPPGTPFTLVPVGELVSLPWQTAYEAPGDAPPGFLLDAHAVAFAPAMAVLPARRGRRASRCLGVAVGRGTGLRELAYAEREVRAVAALFDTSLVLVDEEATPERVLAWLAGGGVVHFACHAETDAADPLDSALVLAGGARLTVRDLLEVRGELDLVMLSACATSVTGRELPDEVVGLPGTLIGAGAGGVVSAAWPVDDLAACLVMTDFAGRWAAGATPAEALRAAQTALRNLAPAALVRRLRVLRGPGAVPPPSTGELASRPFGALHDWGAFTYTGRAEDGAVAVEDITRNRRTGDRR